MKAQELRIGNWVKDHGKSGLNYQVSEITKDAFVAGAMEVFPAGMHYDFGIPLTAEWLERFGFTKIKNALAPNAYTMDGFTGRGGTYFDFQCDDDGVAVAMTDDMLCIPHVKYVHQLQNLYFALTGTELELTKA